MNVINLRISLLFSIIIFNVNAQVGIGNTNPQATLDIEATSTTSPANNDGILIPRMSTFPSSPAAAQDGMLIFYTGTGADGKGFYYWDQITTDWIKIASGIKRLDDLDDAVGDGTSIFIGDFAGNNNTGNFNVGVGILNSSDLDDGDNNTSFGTYAMHSNISGNNNVAIGSQSLQNNLSHNNTVVGYRAGFSGINNNNNVFLGHQAGYNELGSNKLYIENSDANSTNALIYGEFDNNILRTNSEFQIGNPSGTGYALPVTDGAANQVMTTDGGGTVTWQTPASFTDTDNQQIDILSLNGTDLEISLQNDGVATQTLDLSSLQDGNGGTLDQAYDYGGAGNGNTITATDGAVTINGEDGILVTGTFGTGNSIGTSSGTRMHFNPRTASFRAGSANPTTWDEINTGDYSAAFGFNNRASGNYSFTFGRENIASGNYSTAYGYGNTASGNYSIAYGLSNIASSVTQTVIGKYARITSSLFSLGNGNNSTNRSNALTILDSGLMNINDEYNMPLTDGTANQVMTTDGAGNVTFQDAAITTNTDNQQIDILNLNGTDLEISLQNDGVATQTLDLSSLQDGTGTDDQTINTFSFNNATNILSLEIENDGIAAQTVNLSSLVETEEIDWYEENTTTKPNAITDDIYTQGNVAIGKTTADYRLDIENTSAAATRGVNILKTDNNSNETSGLYVSKTGNGTGRSHGVFTEVTGTGTGQKYGLFNRITSTSSGNQYGVRNFLSGATSAWQFGTFNNLDNSATGNQYGVYNGMRGASASNIYGVYNEFERAYSGIDDIVGVRNRFSNGTPGTSGMMGVWTDFLSSANGNYYGSRNEFQAAATGNGNKYGTYNQISSSAGGTHYGTYNNVNTNNGWAGYFIGKNYISDRLSIGELNNEDGRINILNNSGSTNPAHIQLTETSANDGPRIQFANASETTNEWTLFGRADNTISNSSFNFFHTTTGNILEIKGDGDVEVNGNLGVNVNNPDHALHLPNNAFNNVGTGLAYAWDTYSDRRIKSEFKSIDNALDLLTQTKPQRYIQHNSSFKDGKLSVEATGIKTLGFIAQELYNVLPEAVNKPKDENAQLWSVDYNKVVPVAIKAIQELNDKNNALKETVLQLEAQLSKYENLEARLLALEKKSNTSTTATASAAKK